MRLRYAFLLLIPVIAIGAYAVWYSYERSLKIAEVEACAYKLEHPAPPTMMRAPDGSQAPVYMLEPCPTVVVPPRLADLIRGKMVFEHIEGRVVVNPYTLKDILLGRYTLGPALQPRCDQSATTTDCSKIPPLAETVVPAPSVPTNTVEPIERWTSATDTPIALNGFSFVLPHGWSGEVYEKAYAGGLNAHVTHSSGVVFSIECQPDGKGFETATRISSDTRTFDVNGKSYSATFEEWTAPGNNPWLFVWLRDADRNIICLAQGGTDRETRVGMHALFETWSGPVPAE